MNPKTLPLLKIIVSVAIIVAILVFVDVGKVVETLPNFNLLFAPLLILLIAVNIVLYVLNYVYLLEKKVPFVETLKDYFVVWGVSLFLPGKIGELGIIPILKKKSGIPYSLGTIATLAPKAILLGFWGLFFFVGLYLTGTEFGFKDGYFYAILAAAIIIVFYLATKVLFYEKIKEKAAKHKALGFIERNLSAAKKMFSIKNSLFSAGIGFVRFLLFLLTMYLAFIAFGQQPNLAFLLMAIAVSETSAFLPISLSGLGVREATFTGVMLFSGTPIEILVGVALAMLLINYSMAVIAIIAWNFPKISGRSAESKSHKKL